MASLSGEERGVSFLSDWGILTSGFKGEEEEQEEEAVNIGGMLN
jgi:hypothetical protein